MLIACGSAQPESGLGLEQARGTGGFDGVFPFDANIPGTVPSTGGAASGDAGAADAGNGCALGQSRCRGFADDGRCMPFGMCPDGG